MNMARTSIRAGRYAVALVAAATVVHAQTVAPMNWTTGDHGGARVAYLLLHSVEPAKLALEPALLPLTSGAMNVSSSGLQGNVLIANNSNAASISDNDVALIDCDPAPGYLQPGNIFSTAVTNGAKAVVFYSRTADYCNVTGNDATTSGYAWQYSTKSRNDSLATEQFVDQLGASNIQVTVSRTALMDGDSNTILVTGTSDNGNETSTTSPTPQPSQMGDSPLGPSPTTAVAMIILYSITGIITALFLVIIVTGAVRAHRHPERYGPRGGIGRPRQSRARGLARAMLDSLPIVKVGEREEKPRTDVEMTGGESTRAGAERDEQESMETSQQETPESSSVIITTAPEVTTATTDSKSPAKATATATTRPESGIAAATSTSTNEPNPDHQGCSICTEDFKPGEDQRVLPCDHRFHPDCIDPWLLNVSGTCPLCRIDLRPASARSSAENAGEDGLAPPLENDPAVRRMSARRSILFHLTGFDSLPLEERISALRELRRQRLAERRRQSQQPAGAEQAREEEELGLRRRLRNAFRVRTRRTGEEDGNPGSGDANPEGQR